MTGRLIGRVLFILSTKAKVGSRALNVVEHTVLKRKLIFSNVSGASACHNGHANKRELRQSVPNALGHNLLHPKTVG
jgi:hypothetical protein